MSARVRRSVISLAGLSVVGLAIVLAAGCGGARSHRISSTTAGARNVRRAGCGSGSDSTPQRAFELTAPGTGRYVLESRTRDYDGVLSVWDPSGRELACNDDSGSTRRSRVEIVLVAGQTVEVIQGGYAGAAGAFELQVTARDPVDGELVLVPIEPGSGYTTSVVQAR